MQGNFLNGLLYIKEVIWILRKRKYVHCENKFGVNNGERLGIRDCPKMLFLIMKHFNWFDRYYYLMEYKDNY